MNINSFSASGIATNVWGNATRTLTADPATDAGAATLVWTHASRTLSANPVTYTDFALSNTLAAGTVLDLRPGSGKHRSVNAADTAGGTGTIVGMYDGTTFTGLQAGSQSNQNGIMFGGHTTGPALKNTTGSTITYVFMGFDVS
jgi:hypothetical protein